MIGSRYFHEFRSAATKSVFLPSTSSVFLPCFPECTLFLGNLKLWTRMIQSGTNHVEQTPFEVRETFDFLRACSCSSAACTWGARALKLRGERVQRRFDLFSELTWCSSARMNVLHDLRPFWKFFKHARKIEGSGDTSRMSKLSVACVHHCSSNVWAQLLWLRFDGTLNLELDAFLTR